MVVVFVVVVMVVAVVVVVVVGGGDGGLYYDGSDISVEDGNCGRKDCGNHYMSILILKGFYHFF